MAKSPIARTARNLRTAVFAAMLLVFLVYLVGRLGLAGELFKVESAAFTAGGAAPWFADLSTILFLAGLWFLAKMLGAMAEGPLFGPAVTRSFRGFALLVFLSTLVDVVAGPAIALFQALGGGAAHGPVELKFQLRDLMLLCGSLFLFLLARMLEQARAYEAELEDIV